MIPLLTAPASAALLNPHHDGEPVPLEQAYSEAVTFSRQDSLPRTALWVKKRPSRRARRLYGQPSISDVWKQFEPKEVFYEWVDYSAPVVCLKEDLDGFCLHEEPAPCAEDPHALVCSVETRQLPQKRKKRPWVSVCIDDMGVDYYMSKRAVRLRPAVTLSYLPYGPVVPGLPGVREQARAASAVGHELLVHLPMEPFNKAADAGPNALYSSMTRQQLKDHLNWALAQFEGYVGVNNHMGSLFTSQFKDGMKLVLEELHKRDLFFLDSLTAKASLGQELAAHLGTTFGARDVFLDSQRDNVAAVESRLHEVEQLALKNGHAIAIGHPYEATLEALEKWLPLLDKKGLLLMPLKKALLRERKERERAAGEAVLAITKRKQLQAAAAYRAKLQRERCAQAVAAELEAQFGDGTVFAWQALQEEAAVAELRGVLERRKRRTRHSQLLLNLQSLLHSTLGAHREEGMKEGRGRKIGRNEGGERAVRRGMRARKLADVVNMRRTRVLQGHSLHRGRQGKGKAPQQSGHGINRRMRLGPRHQGGLLRLLLGARGAPFWDMAAAGLGCQSAGVQMASSWWLHGPLLLSRGQGQDERMRRDSRGARKLIGSIPSVGGCAMEETPLSASLYKKDANREILQSDLMRLGVLMLAFLHQMAHLAPLPCSSQSGSWDQRIASNIELALSVEAREMRVGRPARKAQYGQDSPRTVFTGPQEECDSEASSRASSPLGSIQCSLSSNWSFEVEKEAETEGAADSSSVAGSSMSGVSWAGPGEAGSLEATDAGWELAAKVAAALVLSMLWLAMSKAWPSSTDGAPTYEAQGDSDPEAQEAQHDGSRDHSSEEGGGKELLERKEEAPEAAICTGVVNPPVAARGQEALLAAPTLIASAVDGPPVLLPVTSSPSFQAEDSGCSGPAIQSSCNAPVQARQSRNEQAVRSASPWEGLPSVVARLVPSDQGVQLWQGAGTAGKKEGGPAGASVEVQADHQQGVPANAASLDPCTLTEAEAAQPDELAPPDTPSPQGASSVASPDVGAQAPPGGSVAALVETGRCNAQADDVVSIATSASYASLTDFSEGEEEASTDTAEAGKMGEVADGVARAGGEPQEAVDASAATKRLGLSALAALLKQPEKRAFQPDDVAQEDAHVHFQRGQGQSTSKQYSWWRFSVGCMLGSATGMTKESPDEAKRPVGLNGRRQVVPLNLDEE